MPVSQEAIYYLIGESRELLENSPYVEGFKSQDQEVLLLHDPVDEFLTAGLTEYKGKKLKAVDRGTVGATEIPDEKKNAFQLLLDFMKGKLTEVKDVCLSTRLKESAACLVAEEGQMGAHMERLFQRMGRGQELPASKRILELNADHPTVTAIQQLFQKDPADARLEAYCRLLYDEAVIAEGNKVRDPLAFARYINDVVARDATR